MFRGPLGGRCLRHVACCWEAGEVTVQNAAARWEVKFEPCVRNVGVVKF
jgi:hypothetical protein